MATCHTTSNDLAPDVVTGDGDDDGDGERSTRAPPDVGRNGNSSGSSVGEPPRSPQQPYWLTTIIILIGIIVLAAFLYFRQSPDWQTGVVDFGRRPGHRPLNNVLPVPSAKLAVIGLPVPSDAEKSNAADEPSDGKQFDAEAAQAALRADQLQNKRMRAAERERAQLFSKLKAKKLLNTVFFAHPRDDADSPTRYVLTTTGNIQYTDACALFDEYGAPEDLLPANDGGRKMRDLKNKLLERHGEYLEHFGFGIARFVTANGGTFTLYGALSNTPNHNAGTNAMGNGSVHTEVLFLDGTNVFRDQLLAVGMGVTKIKVLFGLNFTPCSGCCAHIGLAARDDAKLKKPRGRADSTAAPITGGWLQDNATYGGELWCDPMACLPNVEPKALPDDKTSKRKKMKALVAQRLYRQGRRITTADGSTGR